MTTRLLFLFYIVIQLTQVTMGNNFAEPSALQRPTTKSSQMILLIEPTLSRQNDVIFTSSHLPNVATVLRTLSRPKRECVWGSGCTHVVSAAPRPCGPCSIRVRSGGCRLSQSTQCHHRSNRRRVNHGRVSHGRVSHRRVNHHRSNRRRVSHRRG